jgi:oligosaccharide repeat unit polymerase
MLHGSRRFSMPGDWHSTDRQNNAELGQSRGSLLITLFFCIAILGLSCYSMLLAADSNGSQLAGAYTALAVEGILFAVLIVAKYGHSGIYIFEPFTIITLTMVLVYLVAPIFQFAAGSTGRYGVDVVRYCVPATGLVILGYLAFFLGYEFPIRRGTKKKKSSRRGFTSIPPQTAIKLVRWAYLIWVVAYLLSVFYYLNKGFDLLYIITGGLSNAEANQLSSEDELLFLAYSKFLQLGAWMMIYAYGKSKIAKSVTFVLTSLCFFLGGGRLNIMIALLAPVVFYYARKKKSPKGILVAAALIGLVGLFAFMQVARVGVKTGVGIDMSGVTLDQLLNPFYSEIDDFKSFYALLGVVPSKHDYLYGSEMIVYSFILLIPRAIFPGKPDPAIYDIIELSLGPQAVANGNAYPALGEYYVEFGVIGVFVCMWLLGVITRQLKNCYLKSEGKSIVMMVYAIVYPSLLSIVIRGYMPQNFSMLLFLLLPLGFFYLLQKAEERRSEEAALYEGDAPVMKEGVL